MSLQKARAANALGGNRYDKYNTQNPIARRMMSGFLQSFEELSKASGARQAHEIGCGEGELTVRLARWGIAPRGCDFSERAIQLARQRSAELGAAIDFRVADIYHLTPDGDAAELVVCCEVMEHLEEPERALAILSALARPYLLVSVPREPVWRVLNMARGKYWGEWGNTPGHVQHWSAESFLKLLRSRVEVVEWRTPLPWTMALCRVRG